MLAVSVPESVAVFPRRIVDHNAADVRLRVGGIVLPELDAIDVVVGEPQPTMVQVVAALSRDVFHGKSARHDLARSGPQRRQKRFVGVIAVMKRGERLAIDIDTDVFRRKPNLGRQASACGEAQHK
jgi:hypothetical protein